MTFQKINESEPSEILGLFIPGRYLAASVAKTVAYLIQALHRVAAALSWRSTRIFYLRKLSKV